MRALLYILSILTLVSCNNAKRIAEGKPLRQRDPSAIMKQSDKASLQWEWLGLKLDADVNTNGKKDSFTLNVRMHRDSAIWISLTPALGVEAARILMTEDSVKMISKVPLNKFVYEGDYKDFQKSIGVPFDYYDMEELFTGMPLGLDPYFDRFLSHVDGNEYALIERFPRKISKLLGGLTERDLAMAPDSSLNILMDNRRANRVINRANEEDLLIKRYWFDGITYHPTRDLFNDLNSGLTVQIIRTGDEEHRQGYLPSETTIKAYGKDVDIEAKIEVKRSRVDREYDLPFDPPEDYERRTEF